MKKLKLAVYGEINLDTFCQLAKALSDSAGNFDEILLLINSTGGNATQAFAIYDMLRATKKVITTIALGNCMSAAPALFALGKKRYISQNTKYMLHKPRCNFSGDTTYTMSELANILNISLENIQKLKEVLKASSRKVTDQWLEQVFGRESDTILSISEVLSLGLATDILDDLNKV